VRICYCYWTLLPHAYFNRYKVKLDSDPAAEKSKQTFPMTTTRGVGKVPANPAVLGPRGPWVVLNVQNTTVMDYLGLAAVLLGELSIMDPCYGIWENVANSCRGRSRGGGGGED
jgi:hypothetical protein